VMAVVRIAHPKMQKAVGGQEYKETLHSRYGQRRPHFFLWGNDRTGIASDLSEGLKERIWFFSLLTNSPEGGVPAKREDRYAKGRGKGVEDKGH